MKILDFNIGLKQDLLLIAGPCVIESEKGVRTIAENLKQTCSDLQINLVFKASFDKANRSSNDSYRGPGVSVGLEILSKIKTDLQIPILTDVHEDSPLDEVASVVDVLQTPAFLVRQTNFIQNVCKANLPVNIKKGQFQAPWDMGNVVAKAKAVGNNNIMLCDRGTSFGYNTLISDMRSLVIMRDFHKPIIFDATHSVQQPGALGAISGGQKEFVPALARAAVATGVSGVFIETHPEPEKALSDGPNMLPLKLMPELLQHLIAIHQLNQSKQLLEDKLKKS